MCRLTKVSTFLKSALTLKRTFNAYYSHFLSDSSSRITRSRTNDDNVWSLQTVARMQQPHSRKIWCELLEGTKNSGTKNEGTQIDRTESHQCQLFCALPYLQHVEQFHSISASSYGRSTMGQNYSILSNRPYVAVSQKRNGQSPENNSS